MCVQKRGKTPTCASIPGPSWAKLMLFACFRFRFHQRVPIYLTPAIRVTKRQRRTVLLEYTVRSTKIEQHTI